MAAHHHFPRLAMWAAQDVPPSRIAVRSRAAGPNVSAIGGARPADGFTTHGAAIDPPSLVAVSSLSVPGGTCLLLNRAAVPQSLHLVNDLAGTMQPELLPIGRTPLGKSRGFIHDLNLSFSRSTFQQTASTFPSMHWASTMRRHMQ